MCIATAHRYAWETYGVLHCDISAGNILIAYQADELKVFLSDWDLAKSKDELATSTTLIWRSVSCLLLLP